MSKKTKNTPNRTATRGHSAQPKPQRYSPRYSDTGFLEAPRWVPFGEHRRYLGLLNSTQARNGLTGHVMGDLLSLDGITEREGWSAADAQWHEEQQLMWTHPSRPGVVVTTAISWALLTHPVTDEEVEVYHVALRIVAPDGTTLMGARVQDASILIGATLRLALHHLMMTVIAEALHVSAVDVDAIDINPLPVRLRFANSISGSEGERWESLTEHQRALAFQARPVEMSVA